jgi:crossover junction endodeoxyribonuclease RusA
MITVSLPYPPSVNSYWRHVSKGRIAGRVLISEAGRAYRKAVSGEIAAQAARMGYEGHLKVSIVAYPPDGRRRDLDNVLKALLDSLAHAGVYRDDCQIYSLQISRGPVMRNGGSVTVSVSERSLDTHWREALGDAA